MKHTRTRPSRSPSSARRTLLLGAAGAIVIPWFARVVDAFAQAKKTASPAPSPPPAPKVSPTGGAAGTAAALTLVDEKSQMATVLKYQHDASKVPAALRVPKQGVAGKDQLCSNCMFYAKAGDIKGDEVGKCQLIPQGVVKAKGWCTSWMKKA